MPSKQRQTTAPAESKPFSGDALDVDHFDENGDAVFNYETRPQRGTATTVAAFLRGGKTK